MSVVSLNTRGPVRCIDLHQFHVKTTDGNPCHLCALAVCRKKRHFTQSGNYKIHTKWSCKLPQNQSCPLGDNEYYSKD